MNNNREQPQTHHQLLLLLSLKGDEVVWVRLVIMEHNIHVGFVEYIHHTVAAVMGLLVTARRRNHHVASALGVGASQDSSHKH